MTGFFQEDRAAGARRMRSSVLAAFALEAGGLVLVGLLNAGWLRPRPPARTDFVQAQLFEMPRTAHLVSRSPVVKKAAPEQALSKVPGRGRKAKTRLQRQNQAQGGPQLGPTHGAVALYAPAPVIPPSLRNQAFNSSVVIGFLVTARGQVTPRLLQSSGSDQLDAIALEAVSRWKFSPAARDNQPVDSRFRLRILFQVS